MNYKAIPKKYELVEDGEVARGDKVITLPMFIRKMNWAPAKRRDIGNDVGEFIFVIRRKKKCEGMKKARVIYGLTTAEGILPYLFLTKADAERKKKTFANLKNPFIVEVVKFKEEVKR